MENMALIKMEEYQELLTKSKRYNELVAEHNNFTRFLNETGRNSEDMMIDYEKWKDLKDN